jgi:hypothetical protein
MWAFALLGVDDDGAENMCSKNQCWSVWQRSNFGMLSSWIGAIESNWVEM